MLGLAPRRKVVKENAGQSEVNHPITPVMGAREEEIVADIKEVPEVRTKPIVSTNHHELDLDAFASHASGQGKTVRFQGKTYQMKNLRELTVEEVVDLLSLHKVLAGKGIEEQLRILQKHAVALVPDLPVQALYLSQLDLLIGSVFEAEGESRPPTGSEKAVLT